MEVVLRITSGPNAGRVEVLQNQGSYLVGRAEHVPVSLREDRMLSREHLLIEVRPPICELLDLGSTNGTKVNGLNVERVRLSDGDIIVAGDSTISVGITEMVIPEHLPLRCAGCGTHAAGDTSDRDVLGNYICPKCEALRQQFPRTHPDFLIEKLIGSGGMGQVYLARQLSTNRPVAIKLMITTGEASNKAKQYFKREMAVLQNLLMPSGQCHPNIVAFYDIFEIDGHFQLVMEFVPGRNALEWVTELSVALPVSAAARIGRSLLAALDYSHKRGFVHRDVKPSNIFIMGPSQRPKLKLGDFGLAKSFENQTGSVHLTHVGDVGGSVGFISPDHIRGFGEIREPADIYSAGATLFYLMTRRYPYLNFDPFKADAYTTILENPSVPLRAYRPDAPEGLERVLAKALMKQPRDRWKSAAAMANALQPFAEGTS